MDIVDENAWRPPGKVFSHFGYSETAMPLKDTSAASRFSTVSAASWAASRSIAAGSSFQDYGYRSLRTFPLRVELDFFPYRAR